MLRPPPPLPTEKGGRKTGRLFAQEEGGGENSPTNYLKRGAGMFACMHKKTLILHVILVYILCKPFEVHLRRERKWNQTCGWERLAKENAGGKPAQPTGQSPKPTKSSVSAFLLFLRYSFCLEGKNSFLGRWRKTPHKWWWNWSRRREEEEEAAGLFSALALIPPSWELRRVLLRFANEGERVR